MSLVNSEQKTLDLKAAKKAFIFRDGVLRSGCSAGFLNVPKIKGSHTAMKRPGSTKRAFVMRMRKVSEGEVHVAAILFGCCHKNALQSSRRDDNSFILSFEKMIL